MKIMILSAVAAFVFALALGPVVIPWLTKKKFGQNIYELAPESHKKKQGVPTMGGIIFAVPMLIVSLAAACHVGFRTPFLYVFVSAFGFGAIGFTDDFIKIHMKRNLGLTPIQKIVPQVVLAVALSVAAYLSPNIGSKWILPFSGREWDLGFWFIPITVFVLVGTVNSANLLDGLDGLLSKVSAIDFLTLTVIVVLMGGYDRTIALFGAIAVGSLMGFLRYNGYPARTFMGDVGSFTLGGALVGMTLVTRLNLLLPIIAFAMVVSALSDIIQIGYFKLTHGKRVFRMAPLHHHFELGGMPEPRIITMYATFTAMLCIVALWGFAT